MSLFTSLSSFFRLPLPLPPSLYVFSIYSYFGLLRLLIFLFLCVFLSFSIYFHLNNKCDMTPNLLPLLKETVNILSQNNISYWMDYGTLLGGMRGGALIPWEFDVDMGTMESECDKILLLKQSFADVKLESIGRGVWIPEKYNPILGVDGEIHKPCVRVYDQNRKYYVDIDWHKRFTGKGKQIREMEPKLHLTSLEKELELDSGDEDHYVDIICNEEGINGGDPGGCRPYSSTFPLKSIEINGVISPIPYDSSHYLTLMYGDNWRIPRAKGYKILFCEYFPQGKSLGILWILMGTIGIWYCGKHIPRAIHMAKNNAQNPNKRHHGHGHSQGIGVEMPSSTFYQKLPTDVNMNEVEERQ